MKAVNQILKMAFYQDIIIAENGVAICILCNTTVPDNNICIEAHINHEMHKDLFIKRLMIQNNIKYNKNQFKCLACKHNVEDMSNLLKHIQSRSHVDTMVSIRTIIEKDGQLIQLPESLKDNGTLAHCSMCNLNVDFNLKDIRDHICSARHKRARCIAVQPLNGIFSVDGNNNDLWCKICEVYFDNYVELILEHVDEDPEHTKRLNKILRLINGQNIVIDKYLTDPKEDKATCQKCNIKVSCNVDNLERHIKGKRHR